MKVTRSKQTLSGNIRDYLLESRERSSNSSTIMNREANETGAAAAATREADIGSLLALKT